MGNKYSRTNLWGDIEHFDEKGKKIGVSRKGFFEGDYVNYDAKGHRIGTSREQLFGIGYNHYDEKGKKIGSSDERLFGGYTNRNASGKVTGRSDRSILDLRTDGRGPNGSRYRGNHPGSQNGCYIATCVYGSYDCPEVWTLRRFRDQCLARNAAGRLFIKGYYKVSPSLVRRYGGSRIFRSVWKAFLDRLVKKLFRAGYKNTGYIDNNGGHS